MHALLYALLCVVVPVLWGAAVSRLIDRLEDWAVRRREVGSSRATRRAPEIDYHI